MIGMETTIAQRANTAIFTTLVALHGLVLFGLPLLLARSGWWALALVPMAWLSIVHWGLIHEAIHKLLFRSPRANELGGRALSILMGPSFHVLRFGHLMHHKLNRDWHAETVQEPTFVARAHYYFDLLFGLYLSEIVTGWLLALLPRRAFMRFARATFLKKYEDVAVAGERFFWTRGNIRPLRVDVLLSLALYGAAFALAGPQWPWIATFLAGRALVISFMDNIYHYATPLDNSKPGKELALPKLASILLLHGNYHETHHRNPDVPWAALPGIHRAQGRGFDGAFGGHALMQFAVPVMATAGKRH
jgi:fatty acid desaturase